MASGAQSLQSQRIRHGTKRTYRSQLGAWREFCRTSGYDIKTVHLQPDALQDHILSLFIAFSCFGFASRKPVSYDTFKIRFSAVKDYYKARFFTKLSSGLRVEMALAGYQRNFSTIDRPRLPVSPELLRAVGKRLLARGTPWALLCWGCAVFQFFVLGRPGEIWRTTKPIPEDGEHIVLWRNVTFGYGNKTQKYVNKRTQWVEVVFEQSKGDRKRKGVVLRFQRSGDPDLCIVKAVEWIQRARKQLGIINADTFISETGRGPIACGSFAKILKEEAYVLGLDHTRISGHSMRIGGATQLFAAGCSDVVLRLMGRWSSDCFRIYLKFVLSLNERIDFNLVVV